MTTLPHAEEIHPGLFRIDTPLGGRVVSLYVLRGTDGAMLFDTGVRGTIPNHLLPALAGLGIAPEEIATAVVSHCDVDHFGGISDVRAFLPSARIAVHASDRAAVEDIDTFLTERGNGFAREYGLEESEASIAWMRDVGGAGPVDGTVADGDIVDLGGISAEILHLPGHTHGHLGLWVPEASAYIVGDAVLADSVDLADGTPAFPPTYRYVADYRRTTERLRARPARHLLTAHYPTCTGVAALDFLDRTSRFVDNLEVLVLGAIPSELPGVSLPALLDDINPFAGRWPVEGTTGALAYPVVGHLEDLGERGLIERHGERGDYRWTRR